MTDPNQLAYLDAMGIPVWVSRDLVLEEVLEGAVPVIADADGSIPADGSNSADGSELVVTGKSPCTDSASGILDTLDDKTLKHPAPINKTETVDRADIKLPDCSTLDWHALQAAVESCQLCGLQKNRTQTVFGSGNQQADWMIIGEAPAAEEDRQGQPFVGSAGQLLTNMLSAIKLSRDAVYIANVLKCRPPNNRDPENEEALACSAYLARQLDMVEPKIILAVGRVAAQNILQSKEPLARLRGRVHQLPERNIPVVVTYHPAYLLRKPADKRKAWEDLKLAYSIMNTEK